MKTRLLLLLILLLSACTPATPTPTEEPAQALVQTEAPTEPPATELPPTEPPEIVCARLISPKDGSYVPIKGKVTFAWEPVDGTDSYQLNFTLPNGTIVTFETDETAKDRYMEAFGMSGEFEWNVTALNVSGDEICSSILFKFTKPTATGNPNGNGTSGSNPCAGPGCGGDHGNE